MNTAKLIIIGAGASGIAAASKLLNAGFQNVLVLEAEDRIGGRICTVPFGQNVIDLGAQWCHGEKDNVVFDLASKYNPFDSSLGKYSQFICYQSDGRPIPQDITNRLTAIFHGLYEISKTELVGYKKSLGDYLSDKYKESLNLPENRDIDRNVAAQFYEFYQKFENSIEASDSLFNVSAEGYLQYWECDGDPLLNWKDKGYVSVLHILMGSYPDLKSRGFLNSRILLGKKVEQVIWDQPNGAINCLVKCSDGSVYEADHVICTASLGVLKDQHTKLFSPKLPLWKLRPIEGLTLGTVDKLFLEFPKPFWPKDWTGASLMWRPEDLPEIRNRKDSWIEDVFGFYVVDYQPNVLCGWITGASARRMEKDSDEVVIAGLMFLLRKFLKQNIPDPIGFRRSNWFTNPNFRGSYSFRSMQTQQMNTSAAELAKPINKPNSETPALLFAGEATNDHYYSTVHGAIGSGWREANRLIQLYKSQKLGIEDFNRDKTCRNGISERKLDSQSNGECETEAVDVIIVGGGLAGLGAGHRFKDSGLKFKILEAQNYFGGRVLSKEMISTLETQKISRNHVPHATVDIGAQWLHGEMNKLYEIGQKNNLLLEEISEEGLGVYIREDGHVIDELFRKKIDFKIGQILEKCESFIDRDDFPKSLGCFLKEEFEKVIAVLETQQERTQASQLYDWHDRFQVIDNSCLELTELSAKFWGFYSLNGESCQAHINFKNGFSRLVECITKEIGLENLHDRSEVSDISWNVFENETGLIEVRTKSGQVFYTNHVIITCSLGVLKTVEQKLFRPQLPSTIQNTIHDMGFETINKIFLQFETPWWGDLEGIQLIYNDNCYEKHKWTRYITGFDILKPGTANTLLAWVGSYGAREMEKLTDHQIVQDCVELLRKFMRCTVPQPIRYYCSRWGTNEFIRGGYSFISTKCDRNGLSGGKILSKPITLKDLPTEENNSVIIDNIKNVSIHENRNNISNKNCLSRPLLLFAGEACHDKYFSTAHGAFLSGIDQAQQILNYYSN